METLDAVQRAELWAKDPSLTEKDQQQIHNLLDQENTEEIQKRFSSDLEFGTGGIRSIYGLGSAWINQYTIRRASHAVCLSLKKAYPNQDLSISLSYDSRLSSPELALITARVYAAHGIKVYLFKEYTPVPVLSFSITHMNLHAGIMITASHNPREYNGYKVYWSDGAQVTPPVDQDIIQSYIENADLSQIPDIDLEKAKEQKLIVDMGESIFQNYNQAMQELARDPIQSKEKGKELEVIYTPLHGTGNECVQALAKQMGFSHVYSVPEQAAPDGNFPTIKYPNPEEAESLKMAIDLMHEQNADIVIGSDTDTDRLGVAIKEDETTILINGNEIAVLLLEYTLRKYQESERLKSNPIVTKTIVTSEMQQAICDAYGVKLYNTLTGFKWIGPLRRKLDEQKTDYQFVFGSEESFGYLTHPFSRDKDGISAATTMMECALDWKLKGFNLKQALNELYKKYGVYKEELLNFYFKGLEGPNTITKIMETFRGYSSGSSFGPLKVSKTVDYTQGLGDIPPSNVFSLEFNSGTKLFLRPSGTEPKIKFYILCCQNEFDLEKNLKLAQEEISLITQEINKIVGKFQ